MVSLVTFLNEVRAKRAGMRLCLRRSPGAFSPLVALALMASVTTAANALPGAVEQSIDSAAPNLPSGAINMLDRSAIPSINWKMADDVSVWKTITLGTIRNVNALLEALSSDNCEFAPAEAPVLIGTITAIRRQAPSCHIGDSAAEIIGRPVFHLSRIRLELDLVAVSLVELGFPAGEDVALEDIHARADMLGYALCPAEAGAQLRLQYLNQPVGEFLHVGMQPIATYEGELTDLTVGNGGAGLLLLGGDGRANTTFPASTRFVFVRPRL